jgi:signal transduction histidine kinase
MNLLDKYLVLDWDVPLLVMLIIICLVVGSLVTGFLSRLFFHPIQRLRQAMANVGKGDFTTTLDVRGSSREIQEIYTGFNRMTQQLRSTEILQTDFVTNVSHEFKTPLNAIEGYSMLLQDCENIRVSSCTARAKANLVRVFNGIEADLSVLSYGVAAIDISDRAKNRLTLSQGYTCRLTVKNGQILYRNEI